MFPTGEFITGCITKAVNNHWKCFCCDICQQVLAGVGFVKNDGRWVFTLPSITDNDENGMTVGRDVEVMVPKAFLLRWSNQSVFYEKKV